MQLRFLGGAGTVTGSRTFLKAHDGTRLLVDCGLFQGFKHYRERNWGDLEVRAGSLDGVVLTHAHLDHSGWVPRLVRTGFDGPIYCTEATADLLHILWMDAAHIQEEDAAYANRKGFARHFPALPLYDKKDAAAALDRLRPVPWATPHAIGGFKLSFHRVGHILGASCARLEDADTSVLFSGDVGRSTDLLMRPPGPPPAAEFVVLESTYGARSHSEEGLVARLAEVVRETASRGGVLLIPAFAVGRSQAVLWALHRLQQDGEIPSVPLLLDSPMATNTTELYQTHARELRVPPSAIDGMCASVRFIQGADESKSLNHEPGPFVLVSASGMLTGGRVLHHLARLAPNPDNTILIVGYQAPGTRGARLLAGEDTVRLHGREIDVRCHVEQVDGFSAHADANGLLDWIRTMSPAPRRVWLNHGEPASADALRLRIRDELDWEARVAVEGTAWELRDLAASGVPPRVGNGC